MNQYTLVITTNNSIDLEAIKNMEISSEDFIDFLGDNTIALSKYYNDGDYTGLEGGYIEEIEYMLEDGQLNDYQTKLNLTDEQFEKFIHAHKKTIAEQLVLCEKLSCSTHCAVHNKISTYINNYKLIKP